MSMLAEPRRKQRISVDPQNVHWKKNQDKFGQKLMEKMGWKDGAGLGRQEQGITDNIRLKPNHTAKGLGCTVNHDKTWIAHHDDFEILLASLNQKKSNENEKKEDVKDSDSDHKMSIENSSKNSRARIHYQKFTRGKKDLSCYSAEEKSAILGTAKKSKGHKTENTEKKTELIAPADDIGNTTVSKVSVSDYFAAKLSKLSHLTSFGKVNAAKTAVEEDGTETKGAEDGHGDDKPTKIRKRTMREANEEEAQKEVETDAERDERRRQRRERKRLAKLAAEENEQISADGAEEKEERKSKKKQKLDDDIVINLTTSAFA